MRCSLDRKIFAEILNTVVTVIPSKVTWPVLENVLLEVKDGRLALTAFDGDTMVHREVKLEGNIEKGSALVAGRRLAELIQSTQANEVTIFRTGNLLRFEAGKMKAEFLCLAPEEFPKLPEIPNEITFDFPVNLLFEMFDACEFAVSREESKPLMTAINWEIGKNETRMVATDSYRLGLITRKLKLPVKTKLLVTPDAFKILPRDEEFVNVSSDLKLVSFKLKDMFVISRMLEGEYPKYEQVIPKGLPNRAFLDREELISVVRRASIFAHPISKQISLEFSSGSLIVRAEYFDAGKSEEELDCRYEGENIKIGFNWSYLIDVLQHIATEEVSVEMSTPMSPAVFKPVNAKVEGEDLYLLMPIRLET